MMSFITIGRHQICITYKKMKTIRLAFNATTGELKVSAPAGMSEALLKQFLQHRQSWIDKHVAMFEAQVKPHANRYVSGEQHYLEGKAYELQVIENASINRIIIEADGIIMLFVVHGFTAKQRETLIYALYRVRLIQRVTPLIEKWQNIMNVKATKWGVKRMKSRWGSCNTKTGTLSALESSSANALVSSVLGVSLPSMA